MTEPPEKIKADCEGNRDKCTSERCPIFGTLRKPSRDGKRRVRGCGDPVARGGRNRAMGRTKQAKAVRAVGIPKSPISPGHEEYLPGQLRVEVKAGDQVGPIWTRYRAARAQSEAQRPIGDHRPFAMLAMPAGTSHGLLICDLADVIEMAIAVLDNFDRDVMP